MIIKDRFTLPTQQPKLQKGAYKFIKHNTLSIFMTIVLLIWILFLAWRISSLGS